MSDKLLDCGNGEYMRAVTEEDNQCNTCGKKQACISFLAHENAMMHKDVDNERAHRTTLFVCIAFVLIVVIFVAAYTIRTSIWLDTIKDLNAAIVELARAKGIIAP